MKTDLVQRNWRMILLALAAMCGVSSAAGYAAPPRDLERETREFKVSVDGKERGKCTMTISKRDDGSEKLMIDAGMTFDYVVYVYRYRSVGTEVWREGRLVELENTADMGKTRYRLQAAAKAKGLRVSLDGTSADLPADVWTTSYWRIPDRLARPKEETGSRVIPAGGENSSGSRHAVEVSLLDTDKGQKLKGELACVGTEMLTVAGKRQSCAHYRITGEVQVDLWYDSANRLVRQEGVDSGHKTRLELVRLAAAE